ncbi:hypothetical protein [Bacillus xiapuensis]|uniref:Uncharacterized protein n=1 Tax=Bacillus xiapuensis TaxID=2014075 RepID=A0ABU6NC81_9BACI|nr:hypothetical protein [Bacillus xiapuensis]
MEHYRLMVQFLDRDELKMELTVAVRSKNLELEKIISNEIFQRKLQGTY